MKNFVRQLLDWVEQRTGVETATRHFFLEEIPASSGWHQVMGSVALFLFMLQVFTGILLSFNYAGTPGEAYNSVRFIVTQVTAGPLIRGLHHWGASAMIVVVVLHMVQVFVYGAYKKPREATWIAGVFLLLLVLGFGLTGYLLPWDNRAYWGTVVATQIAASAPVAGPYLSRLLGSTGGIGVVTFSRFFSLHVLVLPAITALLIAVHVSLVRKHGVTPLAGDTAPKKKFFPGQVFKDTLAIFVVFATLFLTAAIVRVPLERLADPTDTSYIPRPDWYFLFLFQLLKSFEGPLEIVGTTLLPTVAILALLAVPFLDRGKVARIAKRRIAIGAVILAGLCWGGLTATAIATTPKMPTVITPEGMLEAWQQLSPEELAGVGYYRKEACSSCHNLAAGPSKTGPNLAGTTSRRTVEWMIQHFKNPPGVSPGSSMPPAQLGDDQLKALAGFLRKLTPTNAEVFDSVPRFATEGAILYEKNNCSMCHSVNGVGEKVGPALNGLSSRRSHDWVEEHFRNPQRLMPGSIMPPSHFSSREMDWIVSYVLSIPNG